MHDSENSTAKRKKRGGGGSRCRWLFVLRSPEERPSLVLEVGCAVLDVSADAGPGALGGPGRRVARVAAAGSARARGFGPGAPRGGRGAPSAAASLRPVTLCAGGK